MLEVFQSLTKEQWQLIASFGVVFAAVVALASTLINSLLTTRNAWKIARLGQEKAQMDLAAQLSIEEYKAQVDIIKTTFPHKVEAYKALVAKNVFPGREPEPGYPPDLPSLYRRCLKRMREEIDEDAPQKASSASVWRKRVSLVLHELKVRAVSAFSWTSSHLKAIWARVRNWRA